MPVQVHFRIVFKSCDPDLGGEGGGEEDVGDVENAALMAAWAPGSLGKRGEPFGVGGTGGLREVWCHKELRGVRLGRGHGSRRPRRVPSGAALASAARLWDSSLPVLQAVARPHAEASPQRRGCIQRVLAMRRATRRRGKDHELTCK